MAELKIEAQPRTLTGRKVRQLRRDGWVPVVVYGKTQEPVNLQVPARGLQETLQHGGFSQLVEVSVEDGDIHNILIRDIQRDPVSHSFLHADFYAVNMSEKQVVSIQVVGLNPPINLEPGLMVFQALDSVEISALPADIPASVEVDISGVDIENPILISDLPTLPGVEYLLDPSEHVFDMITTRVEEELEALDEELEAVDVEPEMVGEEGEEEAEFVEEGEEEEEE